MSADKNSNNLPDGEKKPKTFKLDKKSLKRSLKKVETSTARHTRKFIFKRLSNIKTSRRYIITWLLVVSFLVAAIGVNFFIIDSQYSTRDAVRGGTYAEGVVGKLETLNPLFVSSSAEGAASQLIFSSLYTYDIDGKLHSDIASSMRVEDGGSKYIVGVKQGIEWHDGNPLTAKDVIFTLDLIKNPDTRARGLLESSWRDIKVELVDNYTLEFSLSPYAAFPHALTFAILPEHILSQVAPSNLRESDYSRSPVGSGPFTYRLLQEGQGADSHRTLHLLANSKYHGGVPAVDRFELHAYQKTDQLVRAIESSEVTGAIGLDESQANSVKAGNYNRFDIALNSGIYALMNTEQDILKNTSVRRAIQRAIDTEKIRLEVSPNAPTLRLPFLASQVKGSESIAAGSPKHSIEEANKLLEGANWKRSGEYRRQKDKELSLRITVLKNQQYEKIADMVADQLEEVGIQSSIQVIDTDTVASGFVQDILQARNYDILIYELPIGADPDVFAYWHSSQRGVDGYNFSNYANNTADVALVSARDQVDSSRRDSRYISFAKRWLADAPAVALYQQVAPYFINKNSKSVDSSMKFVSTIDRYSQVVGWTVSRGQLLKTP